MTFLENSSPEDLVVLTNIIAIALSKNKSADETNVLGNFIVGIGWLMLTIAAQQQYLALKKQPNKPETETDAFYWLIN
ncbi:hypothetical protein LGK95_01215 [Clostridium algoriphilum]|uniref:hypothetical protein n=1 Tax=Clostridium algoriphilum TaxID=198347 RepID=UPI001CF4D6D5|nr:hypothetical protein [Clostridium algoriphilum]MCB2292157.1 hypothetical protein [Clostridium algoriphilum]